jgi:hypothetical protein
MPASVARPVGRRPVTLRRPPDRAQLTVGAGVPRLPMYPSEAVVYRILRALLVAMLVVSLVEAPVWGASTKAVGIVVQAQGAQLDNLAAADGANVYPGDSLATGAGDAILRMRSGTSQLYLLASSSATIGDSSTGLAAVLRQGSAGFGSSALGAVEIQTPLGTIRPKTAQPTHARVTITGPNELLIVSYHGALEVTADDQVYTVADGTSYRLVAEPETAFGSRGDRSGRKRKTLLLLIGLAAVTGVGIYVYTELTESPDKPKSK